MSDPVSVCLEATTATHAFYRQRHAALRNRGYAVMYGPPLLHAPVLTIGYQPGGRQIVDDHLRPEPASSPWPPVLEYATDTYPLAARLQEVFGKPLLRRCTGLNAIFFSSPNVDTYRTEVPIALRREITHFCVPWVEQIVAAVQPRLVLAVGLGTLDLFGQTRTALQSTSGRVLASTGEIGGARAIGTLHLSGARIATEDRTAITQLLRTALEG